MSTQIPRYAGTDCSGCGKFADDCWRELQGETCCVACMDEEWNGHHMEGLDRAQYDQSRGGLVDVVASATQEVARHPRLRRSRTVGPGRPRCCALPGGRPQPARRLGVGQR